jgi:site-specific DNA recombinase
MLDAERRQLERALRRVQVQQDRLTDAYLQGVLELAEYGVKKEALREKQRQLERQCHDLEQRVAEQVRTRDAQARLEAFCQAVAVGLDTLTFAEQQALLRLVVERITVEDGTVRIETVIPVGERVLDSRILRTQCRSI